MNRPQILYVADGIDNTQVFKEVVARLDVDIKGCSPSQLTRFLATNRHVSLLVFDATKTQVAAISHLAQLLMETACSALLLIMDKEQLPYYQAPSQLPCDFVVPGASVEECLVRIEQLLAHHENSCNSETIVVDTMEINLSTYQVSIADEPIDLTYLEYALLAFLITHPGQTYSRDALLQHVWGIDYFGGSRTVDVHVRRVRSKLGPELSQRLETVRGVGYLWRS